MTVSKSWLVIKAAPPLYARCYLLRQRRLAAVVHDDGPAASFSVVSYDFFWALKCSVRPHTNTLLLQAGFTHAQWAYSTEYGVITGIRL